MNEPDISPLAKRLAEENNVRWQELTGTGAGGKVVERDVLEYLARVMSGEEAVDPTPEPVPEGMEAWPEEDMAAYQREFQPGQLSDLQAELSASEQVPEGPSLELDEPSSLADAEELTIPDMATSEAPAEDITEDIFLFEDGDEQPPAAKEPVTAAPGLNEEGLLIADDDDVVAAAPAEEPAAEPEPAGLDLGALDPFAAAEEPFDEVMLEAEVDHSVEAEVDLPELFTDDDGVPAAEADSPELAEAEPVLLETDSDAEVAEAEPVLLEADSDAELAEAEPVLLEADSDAELAEAMEPEAVETIEATETPEAEEVVAATEADDGDVVDETIPGVMPTIAQELPLVSYGTLLRRHLDLTALAAAQLSVSREIDLEEPVPPTSFLLRAAAKAVAGNGFGDGQIALVRFDSGAVLQGLDEAAEIPFRELLERIAEDGFEATDADGVALAVADMSSLDVDEAVLNLGTSVLTLGRILYDNQQGSYRSTLSLSGEVEPDRGAQLLARVAELLASPVQLVL